jgi:hypothetical protein
MGQKTPNQKHPNIHNQQQILPLQNPLQMEQRKKPSPKNNRRIPRTHNHPRIHTQKTPKPPTTITQKEHGATNIITQLTKDIHENLQNKLLPQHANTLYATAIIRLINKCPLKNIQWHL